MGAADYYAPGDHNVICDRTGFKLKRSQCMKQWDNLIVRKVSFEPRHPQDFIRSKPDRQQVPDPRVKPDDKFLAVDEVKAADL